MMAKKKAASVPPKLSETEEDLLSHTEHGYHLETDSLGGNPESKIRLSSCAADIDSRGETIRGGVFRGLRG